MSGGGSGASVAGRAGVSPLALVVDHLRTGRVGAFAHDSTVAPGGLALNRDQPAGQVGDPYGLVVTDPAGAHVVIIAARLEANVELEVRDELLAPPLRRLDVREEQQVGVLCLVDLEQQAPRGRVVVCEVAGELHLLGVLAGALLHHERRIGSHRVRFSGVFHRSRARHPDERERGEGERQCKLFHDLRSFLTNSKRVMTLQSWICFCLSLIQKQVTTLEKKTLL